MFQKFNSLVRVTRSHTLYPDEMAGQGDLFGGQFKCHQKDVLGQSGNQGKISATARQRLMGFIRDVKKEDLEMAGPGHLFWDQVTDGV